eukprot:774623-Pyramimonas_sp.AAC.1
MGAERAEDLVAVVASGSSAGPLEPARDGKGLGCSGVPANLGMELSMLGHPLAATLPGMAGATSLINAKEGGLKRRSHLKPPSTQSAGDLNSVA